MNKDGKRHRGYWKRLIAAALCASITVTTVFPDNGVALAASLEDAVATEETRAANEYAEATEENRATAETASAEEDEIEIEPEEVIEGSDSMDFTGGEGGVSLVDEADPDIEPYATADEFGEIAADVKEEAAIVAEDISKRDQYQKEFKLEDNTRLLVVYPEAVHYEKNGEWEDIDNTLIASQSMNGTSVLINQANVVDMKLPQVFSAEQPISLKYKDYEISFALEGAASAVVDEKKTVVEDGSAVAESRAESSTASGTESNTASSTASEPDSSERSEIASEDDITSEDISVEESLEGFESESEDATAQSGENAVVTEDRKQGDGTTLDSNVTSATDEVSSENNQMAESTPESESANTTTTITGLNGEAMQLMMPAEVAAEVRNDDVAMLSAEAEQELSPRMQQILPKKTESEVKYLSVLPQTDIVYNLTSTTMKESIILHSCPEVIPEYRFFLACEGLTLELQENNEISAKNAEEEIFRLAAPFMEDRIGEFTYNIKMLLEPAEGGYTLIYQLDEDWMRATERQWPLTLDPTISTTQEAPNIKDNYVASKSNKTIDFTDHYLKVGYSSSMGIERSYIMFEKLPSLTSADVIVNASLQMHSKGSKSDNLPVYVHEVLDTWNSEEIEWSKQPRYNQFYCTDYAMVQKDKWYSWKVTDLVRRWYQGENTGLMLKMDKTVEDRTSTCERLLHSSDSTDNGKAYRPILTIQYMNSCGIESYWDYDSYSAGRAGTASINLFSGNLVWTHQGLSFDGARMPVAVNAVYNANDRARNDFAMGYGWRTPYHQLVYSWKASDGNTSDTDY